MASEFQMPPEAVVLLETLEKLRHDMAQKDALLAERDAAIADRDAKIRELTREAAKLTRLKTAAIDLGIHYEAARRWCERGFVESARQQGSLWLVELEDLRAVAIARMLPPTDQTRTL
jgi:hypothetical protein